MKKVIKKVILSFAVCFTLAFAVTAGGCSFVDDFKSKIDKLNCKHENGEYVTAYVAATCTEDGMTEGTKCVDCDAWIVEGDVLPAKGHSPVTVDGYAATCVSDGRTSGEYCFDCGAVLQSQTIIKAFGHDVQVVEEVKATMFKDGFTSGLVCGNCDTVFSGCESIEASGFAFFDDVSNYTETEIAMDDFAGENATEKISGNVYRFYIDSEYNEIEFTLTSTGELPVDDNECLPISMFIGFGCGMVSLNEVFCYKTNTEKQYVDVYFGKGEIHITEENSYSLGAFPNQVGYTLRIDETVTVLSLSSGHGGQITKIVRLDPK